MTYTIDEKKVIYADLDPSEGIVLHLDSKNYYRLNETGQLVWQGLAAGKSADEIANDIAATYAIELTDARSDITEIIDQMRREQLLQGETQSLPQADANKARVSKKQNPIRSK